MVGSGEVTGLWTKNESPYIITGNITVPEDGKLAIQAGVDVLIDGPYIIEISGRLEATGTENENIHFSMMDTTGFSTETYDGWLGLFFMNFSGYQQEPSILKYVNLHYSAGSALTSFYSSLDVSNVVVSYNKGYGLYLTSGTEITLVDIIVSHNQMGGIKSDNSATIISQFEISNNMGPGFMALGGHSTAQYPQLKYGIISNNVNSNNGGGVIAATESHVYLEDVSITDNSATQGGGIYCNMSSLELLNVKITENQAESGGGLSVVSWSNVSMSNCLIADNEALNFGGAIYNSSSNLEIDKSTIAYNNAGNMGSGIDYYFINDKNNSISNSIVWGNYPQEIQTTEAIPEIMFCDIMGGYEGFEVINEDPLFVDADNSNYHLSWNTYPQESGFKSPAIDSGDPASEFDPDGTIADMGAYYFEQTVFTATKENLGSLSLKVYPNPAKEYIKINSKHSVRKVTIVNLAGQLVWENSDINVNNKIDVSSFDNGLYIIKLVTEDGKVMTEKMIKE
jgi:predicted outer membrane repeat protein